MALLTLLLRSASLYLSVPNIPKKTKRFHLPLPFLFLFLSSYHSHNSSVLHTFLTHLRPRTLPSPTQKKSPIGMTLTTLIFFPPSTDLQIPDPIQAQRDYGEPSSNSPTQMRLHPSNKQPDLSGPLAQENERVNGAFNVAEVQCMLTP